MLTERKNSGAFWKMKCCLTHRFFKMRCRGSIFRNVLCSLFSSNNTWWVPTGYVPGILGKKLRPGSAPPGMGPCTGNAHSLGRYPTHNLLESALIEHILWAQSAKTILHSNLHYEVKDFHNSKEVSVQKMEAKHSHSKRHGIPMAPGFGSCCTHWRVCKRRQRCKTECCHSLYPI
jgi:hypothetical protein